MKTRSKNLFFLIVLMLLIPFKLTSKSFFSPNSNIVLVVENLNANEINNFGSIFKTDVLYGYYQFVNIGKVKSGNIASEIKIFDLNFKYLKSINIETVKKTKVISLIYNGDAFMVTLLGSKTNELYTFSNDGNKLGEKKGISKTQSSSYYTLGNYGFMRKETIRNGMKLGSVLKAFNNNLELLWSIETDENINDKIHIVYSSRKYVGFVRTDAPNGLFETDYESSLVFIYSKTGNELFELRSKKIKNSLISSYHLDEENKILNLGGYSFKNGTNDVEGFCLMNFDFDGKVVNERRVSFAEELKGITTLTYNKKVIDDVSLYIHKFHWDSEGKIYIVAEQFKSFYLNFHIDLNELSSLFQGKYRVVIFNLAYLVFDKDFKLLKNKIVEKNYSYTYFPSPIGKVLSDFESSITFPLNVYFGYQFSYINDGGNQLTTVYREFKKYKKIDNVEKNEIIGCLEINNGNVSLGRINLQSYPAKLKILPAKQNHLLLLYSQQFVIKNKLTIAMEPLIQ